MFCMHCGKELWENARFCQACGAPVAGVEPMSPAYAPVPAPAPAVTSAVPDEKALLEEERALVACCRGIVNRERLAWKSVGIILLVFAILLLIIMVFVAALAQEENPDSVWAFAVISLIVSIVNLRMAKKTAALCTTVYTDIRPIIDRYSGSAPVVFAAVFNLIAMIFVIRVATKTKSQTAVLERIVKRQQTPCI